MRPRSVLVWWVCLLLSAGITFAQDQATPWFFAHDQQNGQLLAYTAAGETRTLIDGGLGARDIRGWRTGPAEALLLLEVDEALGLYRASPEGAQRIEGAPPGALDAGYHLFQVFARRGPHLVLAESLPPRYGPALLVDLAALTASPLTGQVVAEDATTFGFTSAGGLRYLSRTTDDSAIWSLRERDPASGAETILHEVPVRLAGDSAYASSDWDGSYWLFGPGGAYSLLRPDASAQPLADLGEGHIARIVVDHLLTYAPGCQEACTFTWQPLAGGEPQRYPLPILDDLTHLRILERLSESELLIAVSAGPGWAFAHFIVTAAGGVTPLGGWQQDGVPRTRAALGIDGTLSPDGRWLLALGITDGAPRYEVWDLGLRRPLDLGPAAPDLEAVGATWGESGFVLELHGQARASLLYRARDGEAIPLPPWDGRRYFAVLADATLLVAHGESAAPTIGHYDPQTGAERRLLTGALPIPLLETQQFEYRWW